MVWKRKGRFRGDEGEQKHRQLEEKISELEDRVSRNRLRFSGITEKAEGSERRKKLRI